MRFYTLSSFLLIISSVAGLNPTCLDVTHSCRSRTQDCKKIKQQTCSIGVSLMETVWITGSICNLTTNSVNINNPDSFIAIQGPAVRNPTNLSSEIFIPYPEGVTQLAPGHCIAVEDFEFQIDTCLSGFTYEVKMITGTQCGGAQFVSAMQRTCPFHAAISCTIVEDEVPCEQAHTMGYTGSNCIQNVRFDFTYSNHVGDEYGDILFTMNLEPEFGGTEGQYSTASIDGYTIDPSGSLFADISTGQEHSFWKIVSDIDVCLRIPDASIYLLATAIDITTLSKRNDYLACRGYEAYEASVEGWKPPVASPVPPISDPFPGDPPTSSPIPVKTPKRPKTPSKGSKRRKSDDKN